MKYFTLFCILVLVFMGGFLLAEALSETIEEPINIPHRDMLPHLIKAHECARDTHQKIIDDPYYWAWYSPQNEREWVRLYNITIEILENLR